MRKTVIPSDILKILEFLRNERGFDFTGYYPSMLERRLNKRLFETKINNTTDYFELLIKDNKEIDNLIDILTINVSRFFRNPLYFEYLSHEIIPKIIKAKIGKNENSLRIWSAGCSSGEEAYSIAIIINEFLKKGEIELKTNIFATDIDKKELSFAQKGKYQHDSMADVKYGLLNKYFAINKDKSYTIDPEIRKMVAFSFYDLLDKKSYVPQESIFGDFDIVLCRNVLIYFKPRFQKVIFDKLSRSLHIGAYLVLGEAEMPPEEFKNSFNKEFMHCNIYRKR